MYPTWFSHFLLMCSLGKLIELIWPYNPYDDNEDLPPGSYIPCIDDNTGKGWWYFSLVMGLILIVLLKINN